MEPKFQRLKSGVRGQSQASRKGTCPLSTLLGVAAGLPAGAPLLGNSWAPARWARPVQRALCPEPCQLGPPLAAGVAPRVLGWSCPGLQPAVGSCNAQGCPVSFALVSSRWASGCGDGRAGEGRGRLGRRPGQGSAVSCPVPTALALVLGRPTAPSPPVGVARDCGTKHGAASGLGQEGAAEAGGKQKTVVRCHEVSKWQCLNRMRVVRPEGLFHPCQGEC